MTQVGVDLRLFNLPAAFLLVFGGVRWRYVLIERPRAPLAICPCQYGNGSYYLVELLFTHRAQLVARYGYNDEANDNPFLAAALLVLVAAGTPRMI
jgi:hypothetical protein